MGNLEGEAVAPLRVGAMEDGPHMGPGQRVQLPDSSSTFRVAMSARCIQPH